MFVEAKEKFYPMNHACDNILTSRITLGTTQRHSEASTNNDLAIEE
jgi:hypothetical protein